MLLKYLPNVSRNLATLIGLTAIFFWSTNVGLIRSISEHFGAIGGAALIYSVSTFILYLSIGLPQFNRVSKTYLIWGSILFVGCELCFTLSIGYAQNGRQGHCCK